MEYELTKHIIREFELSKLTEEDHPFRDDLKVLKDFIEDIFRRSTIVDLDDGYEVIIDNYIYFKQENNILWYDYSKVWSFFHSLKLYNYDEIKELLHYLVSTNINREVGTPCCHLIWFCNEYQLL